MKNLVIVESPTKARTLGQFLGKDYQITASMGHVRDLPRGEFGVDVEHDFKPQYVIPKEKIKAVNNLVKVAAQAEQLWLATDLDREGEAIAWNLLRVIAEKGKVKNPQYQRVVFHEITKEAINEAFEHPRKIDDDLVEAQQARRVLDRLVGYKLSPLLWKKVKSRLSAGRVQSAALRLVVDREREILAFKPEEFWVIEAMLVGQRMESRGQEFSATLIKIEGNKAEVKNKTEADQIVSDLNKAIYKVGEIKSKDIVKNPSPPFTTSTLQQAASTKFGFAPKRTMRIAQDLYENGLITYMRTDSVNLSVNFVTSARKLIEEKFGGKYLPKQARAYKVKSRLAQEAHEAIRPTNVQVTSDKLQVASPAHQKLYDLIWKRTVATQMETAVVTENTVMVNALGNKKYILSAAGQKVKFDGFYKVYGKIPIKEQVLPQLSTGEELKLNKLNSEQKFTQSPARFTEATLIKELEKNEIGRPSTYAPTISTLYERNYIEKLEDKKIGPTPIGKTTVDFLVKHFPKIVDLSFTAEMENDLDLIAQGREQMAPVISKFWEEFEPQVAKVTEEAEKMKVEAEETGEECEKCGKPMVIRYGRFGKFMACSGFPECKNTKTLAAPTGLTCQLCGGSIVMKRTRHGRMFWGCSNYPKCKFASWKKPDVESKKKESTSE
ncbi:DNA topoisomerase I [Candidatus Curtissbacteria bacterium RIFCSPHIGHO2_12_FULL_41_17]|uniref:DNA topoisomerase 1 n=4 Tax=Candidatus Curtissiibacteriota TaxID=1752717 RepID=A0A1F5HIS1_9BACT|nr:MAG: DNA topoisomerase I [Candidatus Curtissbacteria bacterium RIFCSPHIGHO2_01_FULL_40_12]OGE03984.1 MAG: DNA topoisomerase I [Candidatus Curtissbacteria bacterium RIFCSPHIGHO2_12_FULL_41_17]